MIDPLTTKLSFKTSMNVNWLKSHFVLCFFLLFKFEDFLPDNPPTVSIAMLMAYIIKHLQKKTFEKYKKHTNVLFLAYKGYKLKWILFLDILLSKAFFIML